MKAIRGLLLYASGMCLIAATQVAWGLGQGAQIGTCLAWALWASSVRRLLADATHGRCRCGRRSR